MTLTGDDDLEDAGLLLLPDVVGGPALERTVVQVRDGGVVQPGGQVFGRESRLLNFGQVTRVVEGPVEGHHGGVGVDLAAQRHGLLLQGAVELFSLLPAHWGV